MKKIALEQGAHGTSTEIWIGDNEIITVEKANAKPLLDQNQRLRNAGVHRKGGMRPVASVDVVTFHNWKKEWRERHSDKWTWQTYLAAKLNDRDYSKFRTQDSRI
jgi:hypothetical protein